MDTEPMEVNEMFEEGPPLNPTPTPPTPPTPVFEPLPLVDRLEMTRDAVDIALVTVRGYEADLVSAGEAVDTAANRLSQAQSRRDEVSGGMVVVKAEAIEAVNDSITLLQEVKQTLV